MTQAPPPIPPKDLSRQVQEWRRQLLDTSKRNRLINCKLDARAGLLSVVHPSFGDLWEHTAIKERSLTFPWFAPAPDAKATGSAGTPLEDTALGNKLKRLDLAARTSLSEQGVNTLFLAFGFLRWYESAQSDAPIFAPLVLLPVTLEKRAVDSPWDLHPADEDLAPNHPIAELLRAEFSLNLPPFDEAALRDAPDQMAHYLKLVEAAVAHHPRWTVQRAAALGNFAFQKVSMWQDLFTNESRVTSHPLCRALAGDASSLSPRERAGVRAADQTPDAPDNTSDITNPDTAHIILDCDSSQHQAVDLVKAGKNLLLDGPPGTGKSQTIANIIAQCLADGKTVLFVSEKAAALEVVKRRLDARRLGDFCLECHSHKANKRSVVRELDRALGLKPETYPNMDDQLAALTSSRDRLSAYVRALHAPRSALNLCAFDAHARYTAVRSAPVTRQTISNPHAITHAQLSQARAALENLIACAPIIDNHGRHPWRNATAKNIPLSLPDDIRHHVSAAAQALDEARPQLAHLLDVGFQAPSDGLAALQKALQEIPLLASAPLFPPDWAARGMLHTAQQFTRLHALSQTYAQTLATLPGYRPDAITQADLPQMTSAAHALASLKQTLPALPDNLTAQIDFLQNLLNLTRELFESLDAIANLTQTLHQELALQPHTPPSLDSALALAQDAATLALLKPADARWFTPQGPAQLAKIAHEAAELANLSNALRTDLETNFSLQSVAFSRAALPQIQDVVRHDSFFSRLSGSWRRARRAVIPFYKVASPFWGGSIVDDMFRVQQWHTYQNQLQSLLDSQPVFFQTTPGQAPDLTQAQANVKALNALARAHASLETFGLRLASPAPQETQALLQKLTRLRELCLAAQAHFQSLARHARLDHPFATLTPGALPLSEAHARAQAFAQTLAAQLACLIPLQSFVEPNASFPLEKLTAHAQILQSLRDLKSQAAPIAADLNLPLPDIDTPHLGDYRPQAQLAQWLIAFAASHQGLVPERYISPLTHQPARDSLLAAARALSQLHDTRLKPALTFLTTLFCFDQPVSTGITLNTAPLPELTAWLKARAADADRILEWSRFLAACDQMQAQNLTTLRDETLSQASNTIPIRHALDAFDRAFYLAWLQETYTAEPILGMFDLTDHNLHLANFKRLDRFWVHNAFTRVRSSVLGRNASNSASGGFASAPAASEVGILLREANKKRAHLPLRRLFNAIPGLLLRIKPCIMMSPLSVSTYLAADDLTFDVVIFDEASQVRPHDAVCSVYRGKQLVVAGDQKQLPPTDFFEKITDEPIDDDLDLDQPLATRDFESILDVCATLPIDRQRLKWHYRSKRESLISFSNRHFYDNQLVTFPSCLDVRGSSGVTLVHTPDGRWSGQSAGGGINIIEAQTLARAVIDHAAQHPDQSLGVITMNQAQQMRVLDEIDILRKAANPASTPPTASPSSTSPSWTQDAGHKTQDDSFFSPDKPEPFFVKNLENVQGDERDVIFFGVAYAKNDAGNLSHNFGPLNRQGGERRLNVAVTRARLGLKLFSSILADDIDLTRTQSHGARLLKAYLDFAQHPPTSATSCPSTQDAGCKTQDDLSHSSFEDQVAAALQAQNLQIQRAVGHSAFKVDIAITHPQDPSRFILGIECDGHGYRDAATARDRDRLREQVLQSLGWRVLRIWSTDWARDPARQTTIILEACRAALNASSTPKPPDVPTLAPLASTPIAPSPQSRPDDADSIDKIPPAAIAQAVLETLHQFGAMPTDDLFLATAKKLGFARTGPRIKDTLTVTVQDLHRQEKLQILPDNKVKPL